MSQTVKFVIQVGVDAPTRAQAIRDAREAILQDPSEAFRTAIVTVTGIGSRQVLTTRKATEARYFREFTKLYKEAHE